MSALGQRVCPYLDVKRAGLSSLNEGQQIEFEIEDNRGKSSAVNLRAEMT